MIRAPFMLEWKLWNARLITVNTFVTGFIFSVFFPVDSVQNKFVFTLVICTTSNVRFEVTIHSDGKAAVGSSGLLLWAKRMSSLPQSHIQSTSDRIQFNDLQSLLCATLQVKIIPFPLTRHSTTGFVIGNCLNCSLH